MGNDSFATYYISLKKENISDVYGVLQQLIGSVYMTFRVMRMSDWTFVNITDYVAREKLNS